MIPIKIWHAIYIKKIYYVLLETSLMTLLSLSLLIHKLCLVEDYRKSIMIMEWQFYVNEYDTYHVNLIYQTYMCYVSQ